MRRSLFIGLPVALFCAFMIATAGAALFPSIQTWATPLVCSSPYNSMTIHAQSGRYTPNTTVTTYSDACVDAQGHEKPVYALEDSGAIFIEVWPALTLVVVLLTGALSLLGGSSARTRIRQA